ncbi:MAG TPA: GNAT family N-acetyltransferase [Afipia sp.]|uniref:GNAT family N-acetyltransferase n=1 Tax=unclassified Afipia TaxID=2642050 RepID=UPI000463D1F8|nr:MULTISPECIES: GNAT family N-acetyltransferase [unclassified Afipia]MAH69874.1 GNAT family N-acetyltransferase [Afipia sp.]OUX60787.1 MAG: GNAT family N-acetyltransferase [Afipia sp. TMED4]HAO42524.1 GNAT family N-acetyltransferase [Afipia sp.]HAP11155.1 GNAT family N-acetyltransferase [Afipia sp.]HAQ93460.1 GNAT family N-acetyltransferase [Afipia sp.]
MTMAAALHGSDTNTPAHPASNRIARVDVVRTMSESEPRWRAFEGPDYLSTPYQRFELLDAWQQTLGKHEGVSPFIVIASNAHNQPLLLLPLVICRENGAKVARFMGGKHPTFNMALWRRDFAETVTRAELDALVSAIRGQPDGVDVLAFAQQPQRWQNILNPLALLAGQPSTNACPMMTMTPGCKPEDRISTSTRRRLRNKERKLQSLPSYRYSVAATDADINRVLDAFFIIKPQRMALSKLPDIFSDDATKAFVRDACLAKLPNGDRAIELHTLECDSELISVFSCVADGERFSTMFNTYTISDNARYSPGLILLRYMIDHFGDRGYRSVDFGVGSDEYKLTFCKEDEPLLDAFIPLTARGKFAALGMSSLTHAKRLVKHNPALMHMAQLLRNAISR